MNDGFFQMGLHPDSRFVTTFYAGKRGLRRLTRLSQGCNKSGSEFDHCIRNTLAGISNQVNNQDDILVYGKTQDEHDEALSKVLIRFRENNLTLKLSKCKFNCKEVEWYGMIFGKDGAKPDPNKVAALENCKYPQNIHALRSFFGMLNFSARFISNFSTKTAVLRNLLKKGTVYKWTEDHQNCFDNLKRELSHIAKLNYFDPKLKTKIHVDASPYGISAILSQENGPVAYKSRSLTNVECRYSQTEGVVSN